MNRRTRIVAAACTTMIALLVSGGCATSTGADAGDGPSSAVSIGRSSTPGSAPSSTVAGDATDATGDDGYAAYPPARTDASAVQATTPCETGTLTLTGRPDGRGVAMSTTLRNPIHTRWSANNTVTPFAAPEGDPGFEGPHFVTGHTLTLSATNLAGANAVRDPILNHAWPQQVSVDLIQLTSETECDLTTYLSAARGFVDSQALYLRFDRRGGTLNVVNRSLTTPTARISVRTTTQDGTGQRLVRTLSGRLSFGYYDITTTFTGLTSLRNFTTLTVSSARPDGTHHAWVRLTRTP